MPDAPKAGSSTVIKSLSSSRPVLLIAFMMTIMADPVSSVSYAIQAALEALRGNLGLLLQTMGLVIAVIAIIVINYYQLVGRFPEGGGAAAATGRAFGEAWAFVPIGALIVDFNLTIAISVAAGASAIVAYLPALAPIRIILALALLLLVAGMSWFGHAARRFFGAFTLAFLAVSVLVLIGGASVAPVTGAGYGEPSKDPAFLTVLLAFPVAMALATGIEAPSSAIAQLGQLDDDGRKLFGRLTLVATLLVVGSLTLAITALAVRLGIGLPSSEDATMLADLARVSVGNRLYAAFQAVTALLLLAAAASSLQAGPGLLKALAREESPEGGEQYGILPSWLGQTNRYYTPYWGVGVFGAVAGVLVVVSLANEQSIVLFYAVAVFVSFLAGLAAMTKLSYGEGKRLAVLINGIGTLVVFFVLVINLLRGYPLVSLSASLLIAFVLYRLWVRSGRPRGVSKAAAKAHTTE